VKMRHEWPCQYYENDIFLPLNIIRLRSNWATMAVHIAIMIAVCLAFLILVLIMAWTAAECRLGSVLLGPITSVPTWLAISSSILVIIMSIAGSIFIISGASSYNATAATMAAEKAAT
jgi:hypothetical protein